MSKWLPYPLDNGSRMRAFHLIKHLSRRHAVTVFTFGLPQGSTDLAPLRAVCQRLEIVAPVRQDGDRLGLRGLLTQVPRSYIQSDNPAMHGLIRSSISQHDAAIALQNTAAWHLKGYTECPRVFEEVEVALFRERWSLGTQPARRLRDGLTWLKFRSFVRALANDFDWATVVSEPERQHLSDIGCDRARVSVIPNGAEIRRIRPSLARARRLIYPGSVTYSANLDAVRYFAQDILPEIRRRSPGVDFVVTGSTEGVDLAELASGNGVTFTGRLPEVETLIAESAVCVVPLRVGGGTRLKVLQAMALGTPVVSTSKGIEGLDVQPEVHLLVGDTSEEFANHVVEVLHNPLLGERLAVAAHRLVSERYSWQSSGEALEHVIQTAMERHAASRPPVA